MLVNVQDQRNISRIESMVQPIVRLNGREGAVRHFEVLSRFYSKEGEISPSKVFDNHENRHLFYSLDKKIFETSLEHLEKLKKVKGDLEFMVGLNVSEKSVERVDEFVDYAMDLLSSSSLSPEQIYLEVNEKAQKGISEFCEYASSHGFGISIDDIGAEHSTITKVKQKIAPYISSEGRFIVKIDQNFIRQLFTPDYPYKRTDDSFINTALILREETPNTEIVAEGIETEEISEYLAEKGVDFGQGYWYARPMPFAQYAVWLEK